MLLQVEVVVVDVSTSPWTVFLVLEFMFLLDARLNVEELPDHEESCYALHLDLLHKISYLVAPILIALFNTNCKPQYSVTNPNCKLNIICHSLLTFGGITNLQCCNYCHLPGDLSSKFQSSMTIFHHKLLAREGRVLANGWAHPSSIIHDNICSVIHKKCHPKSYHSDIKCHMTLNITFSVAISCSSQAS